MTYDVRVATADELPTLHQMIIDAYDPDVQCSPWAMYPELSDMQSAYRVYVAYTDTVPKAVGLISEAGQFGWLNGWAQDIAAATVDLARAIFHDIGYAWGYVDNVDLRAAIVAASNGDIAEDGATLTWIGG